MLRVIGKDFDAHIIKQTHLSAKAHLFRQGQLYDGLYILQSGWMLLTRNDDNGKRQVFRSILPGEVLGFQPNHHGPAIYSAISVMDCLVCTIPSAVQLCSTYPDLAMRLAWVSACDMLLTEMYLAKISQHSASERIAFMVLELFRRLKRRGLNNNNTVSFPLKQEDIADMLGLTTIHVNRILHALKDKGLFSINHHVLTILDYEALCNLVGSELDMYMACEMVPKS